MTKLVSALRTRRTPFCGKLGWIAGSGEDDLPHRPVNVPLTAYPQHYLYFTVPGDLGEVVGQTRYATRFEGQRAPGKINLKFVDSHE